MHRDGRAKLAGIAAPVLLVALWMTNALLARSQTPSPTQPQPKSQQTQPSPTGETAKPEPDKDNSAADKVYTDDDVEKLPPGGISVVGPPATPPSAATSSGDAPARAALLNQGGQSAKAKAYWQARFAAGRNKLIQDQQALPALQSQLETERVQQDLLIGDTTQVYSDEFMDLLNKVDALKLEIQNDKQALSDLHEEFRKAGGQPGWIR
jgi:cytoskeletal protein RodZ